MNVTDLTKVKLADGAVAIRAVANTPVGCISKKRFWMVRCKCGAYFTQRSDNLRKGKFCKCEACANL